VFFLFYLLIYHGFFNTVKRATGNVGILKVHEILWPLIDSNYAIP